MMGNFKNIFVGGLFLVLAGIFGVSALIYVNNQEPVSEELEIPEAVSKAENLPKGTISLASLSQKKEAILSAEEQKRDSGFLWVDKESSKYMVTLGLANGIISGNHLAVYDDEKHVGYVQVNEALDVISFATPHADTEGLLTKEYYRVMPHFQNE